MTIHDLAEYEILDEHRVEDVQSDGFILRHKKSGARIAILSNNDDNKVFYIGFRTPPEDETGVPHIIEHTTLCGSKKFPVKDPFIELAKGSLNTFLNAMTFQINISCCEESFVNVCVHRADRHIKFRMICKDWIRGLPCSINGDMIWSF